MVACACDPEARDADALAVCDPECVSDHYDDLRGNDHDYSADHNYVGRDDNHIGSDDYYIGAYHNYIGAYYNDHGASHDDSRSHHDHFGSGYDDHVKRDGMGAEESAPPDYNQIEEVDLWDSRWVSSCRTRR